MISAELHRVLDEVDRRIEGRDLAAAQFLADRMIALVGRGLIVMFLVERVQRRLRPVLRERGAAQMP